MKYKVINTFPAMGDLKVGDIIKSETGNIKFDILTYGTINGGKFEDYPHLFEKVDEHILNFENLKNMKLGCFIILREKGTYYNAWYKNIRNDFENIDYYFDTKSLVEHYKGKNLRIYHTSELNFTPKND